MNENKLQYELKRRNFIENVHKYFRFLVDSFSYEEPRHDKHVQTNGTVIRDEISYVNEKLDRMIVLSNGYHPVDYGFELQCFRPSVSLDRNEMFLASFVLKENQKIDQTYVREVSIKFEKKYFNLIAGVEWAEKD